MSFEGYSEGFQENVLQLMYADAGFTEMMVEALEPDHFDTEIHATYAEIFLHFGKLYPGEQITREIVFHEIKKLVEAKRITDEDRPAYIKTFANIAVAPPAPGYIRDEMRDFIASKTLEIQLVNSVDLLKKKKFDEIIDRMNETYDKLNTGTKELDYSVIGDVDKRVAVYSDPEFIEKKDGIPTSVAEADKIMYRNGTGKKEMLVFCGSPGRGKSIALINTALIAMLHGKNVLFYTLEVSEEIVMARIDSCITGIPFVELGRYGAMVGERWRMVKEAIPHMGEIKLLDLPPRYLSPNMLKQHIQRYRNRGFDPDYAVLDYMDLMRSDRRIDDRRLEYGDVYECSRGVAKEMNVGLATASQANRDSLRKRDVDIDSMSEDFSKAMTADYVIGLSQDKREATETTEDGRGTGAMRWFWAKNRNGVKGDNIPMMTDFTRMRCSVEDWERFDVEVYGMPAHKLPLVA